MFGCDHELTYVHNMHPREGIIGVEMTATLHFASKTITLEIHIFLEAVVQFY